MLTEANQNLQEYNQFQVKQLTKLIEVTRTDLKKEDRQKVMNMITIDAHSRDMVESIAESGIDRCLPIAFAFCWVLHAELKLHVAPSAICNQFSRVSWGVKHHILSGLCEAASVICPYQHAAGALLACCSLLVALHTKH